MKNLFALVALVLVTSAVIAQPTPAETAQGLAISGRIAAAFC